MFEIFFKKKWKKNKTLFTWNICTNMCFGVCVYIYIYMCVCVCVNRLFSFKESFILSP